MIPISAILNLRWVATTVLFVLAATSLVRAVDLADFREYEPFVIQTSKLPSWIDTVDKDNINIYYHDGTSFVAIPFQVDQRRRVELKFNIDATSVDPDAQICEYGYFDVLFPPPAYTSPFADETLKPFDEISFMLWDAQGTTSVPETTWLAGSLNNRYQVTLQDSITGAKRYIYIFRFSAPPSDLNTTNYVKYISDCQAGCTSDQQACATVWGQNIPSASEVDETQRVHFGGNWVTDDFEIWPNGAGSPYADMLYRIEYRAPPNETEDTWAVGGEPRYLGPLGLCPASEKEQRIRLIRGVQGAQSGKATTKYEFIYPSAFVTQINLRVHAISYITIKTNHDLTIPILEEDTTYVWTETEFSNVPPESLDEMDASWSGSDPGAAASGDWTESASEIRGNYIQFNSEPRPVRVSLSRNYTYNDKQAKVGLHGLEWLSLPEHQDGVENDGGCGQTFDPEHEDLLFARMERTMYPNSDLRSDADDPDRVIADKFQSNRLEPITAAYLKKTSGPIGPHPPSPCPPTITADDPGSGAVNLSLNTGGLCSDVGFRLYRSEGSGPYGLLIDLGASTSYTDRHVLVGSSYKYKAKTYNTINDESTYSAEKTVTVTDTTPPPFPSNVMGVSANQAATITWDQLYQWILGYNLYMSEISGGPYTKKNGAPISVSSDQLWIQGGLDNGTAYYFVVTSVDPNGNESSYSTEVTVIP